MSTTNERIPEDVLLDVLLEHQDFKDFKKNGNSYRNPSGEQSLTEKGLKDFKSEDFKSLFELAKDRGLLDEAKRRAGLDEGRADRFVSLPPFRRLVAVVLIRRPLHIQGASIFLSIYSLAFSLACRLLR